MQAEIFTSHQSRNAGFLRNAIFRACAKIFTSRRNIHLWIERDNVFEVVGRKLNYLGTFCPIFESAESAAALTPT